MATAKEKELSNQLEALRKQYDVETLNNRISFYGQEALKWKNVKNAARYKAAKDSQKEAKAKLDEYNKKASDLIDQIKTEQKLSKNKIELDKVSKERDFYIQSGEDVPDAIQKKYNKLTEEKTNLKKPAVVSSQPPSPEVDIPVISKSAFGPGIPIKSAGKTTADKTAADKAAADKAAADQAASDATKTAWISYLSTTFQTLPKDQKDQIDKLLAKAKAEIWDEKTFIEALKGTSWWQTTYPTLRQFFLDTHDPRNASTFAQTLTNKMDAVSATLEGLGIKAQQVDPVTGKFYDNSSTIKGIAMEAIKNGWDDNQLMQHLGDNAQILFTGGGTIGSSVEKIKQQALLYGINLDNNYLKSIQYSLLDPTDSRDTIYYMNEIKNQAMDAYKPFADSIKSGRSLYEITNNYRQQMASLLEVDPSAISWNDLMGKVVDNQTGNARMYSDFTKQIKQDPLWQYTKNAKETYSNMALDLMKQFGFMG